MSMFYDLLMAQSKKKKEPIWCEYLESDGGQWIETNIKANNQTTATLTASFPNNIETTFGIFGARTSASINNFSIGYASDSGLIIDFNDSDFLPFRTTLDETILDTNKYSFLISYNKRIIKNLTTGVESIGSRDCPDLFTTAYTLNIFRVAGNYFSQNNSVGKIYSVQLYDNNVLVRNYRPCLHPDTLRPAMYDTVEGKYYYNQGTGEFKYKIGFTKLDYLESTSYEHNANYIDTLIIPTERMSFNIKLQVKYNSWDRPFGADNGYRCEMHSREGFRMTWQYTTVAIPASQTEPFVFTQNKNLCYVNGELVNTFGNYPFTCKVPLRLFSCTDGTRDAICKIYYCEISEEDILKRDYIPVRMNDGRLGMWDFVTGDFFANLGTIKFKGFLNGYQVGESIESNGDQYIDTTIKSNFKYTYIHTYLSCTEPDKKTMAMLGSRAGYGQDSTNIFCTSQGKSFSLRLDILNPSVTTSAIGKNMFFKYSLNGEICIINDESYTTTEKSDRFAPYNDYIFKVNTKGKPEATGFVGACASWLVITKDILQLNLIPVKKDGFIGMIDTLTGKEYPNMGTGSFIFNE